MSGRLVVWAPDGVGEVVAGADLAALLLAALSGDDRSGGDRSEGDASGTGGLLDGDVVTVTSKVVGKAEGRLRRGDRAAAVRDESARVVARRGETVIARTRHGLTLAAAGVDASNVPPGHVLLLPVDPDASARVLRSSLWERVGVNVGVVVTDTAGRAWREGQTDLAVGAAGLLVLEDHAGRTDPYGNVLAVTAPAVADEIAAAAELAQGKLAGRPFAVVRGRPDLVLPPGRHGTGASALVRAEGADLFGYGAREAVVRALTAGLAGTAYPDDARPFGHPAHPAELAAALHRVLGQDATAEPEPPGLVVRDAPVAVVAALAVAHGWRPVPAAVGGSAAGADRADLLILPGTP